MQKYIVFISGRGSSSSNGSNKAYPRGYNPTTLKLEIVTVVISEGTDFEFKCDT